jgi:AraC-like DNA-binding protein
MLLTPVTSPWLERIAPRARSPWRGRWSTGTIEPWRLLYDHELVVFLDGECRVTTNAVPPTRSGPQRHDEQGRPLWHAISGRDAAALAAVPAPGTAYACPAGSFLIIPPELAHLTLVLQGPVVRACFHFDWLGEDRPPAPLCAVPPERPDPALVRRPPPWVPGGVIQGTVRQRAVVEDLIDTFFRRWATRASGERLAARATLLELLVRLLGDDGAAPASSAPELAQAIKSRIDRHLCENRALPDLLGGLERSYEHCCRVFAATYGVPPLRYLTAARIEQAKHLLAQPLATVAAVARAIGYQDAAYFSRVFRAHAGCSPLAYRRQLIASAAT